MCFSIVLIFYHPSILQTIILSSPSKLTKYLDTSQLTEEFGGSFDYNHQEWLQNRLVSLWYHVSKIMFTSCSINRPFYIAENLIKKPLVCSLCNPCTNGNDDCVCGLENNNFKIICAKLRTKSN